MLKLFRVEDGERHWIVEESQAAAHKRAVEDFRLDPEDIEEVVEIADDFQLAVCIGDPTDGGPWPTELFQDERGRWYCSAPVSAWLAIASAGDMICSSVY